MPETHGRDVNLDMSSMSDALAALKGEFQETKKATSDPIDIKVNSKGVHGASEDLSNLSKALKEIKQSKNLQKYFTDIATAQNKLTEAYEKYQSKLKSGNKEQTQKAAADVARWANAFTALGGDPSDVNKKIKSITSNFMKKNNPSTGWLFGVDNFKEVFTIMQQIEKLAPGTFFKNVSNEAEKAGESVTRSAKKMRDSIKNDSIAKNIFDSDEGEQEAKRLVELLDKIWGKVAEGNKELSASDAIDFVTAFQKLNYYLEQTPRSMDDARASLVDFKKFFEDIYDFLPENQRSELTDFLMTPKGEVDQKAMLGIAIEFWQELARSINQASDAQKDFYSNQFVEIPKLTEEQQIYRSIVEQLREFYDLKKKVSSGNLGLVTPKGETLPSLVRDNKDVRKGKDGNYHVTQASLKRLLAEYDALISKKKVDKKEVDEIIDKIAAYTNALDKDVDAKNKIFGETHADLFNEVALRIKNAEEAAEAFNKQMSLMRTISLSANSLGTGIGSPSAFKGVEEALESGGVEGALKYLVETMGMKLPEAAREAADAMDKEASSEKKAGDAAEDSATSDDKAAKAKKEKAKATEESAEASKKEAEAEQEAAKKREEANKTAKHNAELLAKQRAEAEKGVFKNEIHGPNGAVTATEYVDYFRTKTTQRSYDKNGELQFIERTTENYVALEKQIQSNDKEITRLTKDMLLNAKVGADTSAWENQIDALEEYNRVLLEIRNNGWVVDDDFLPRKYHADVFDAERLKAQEKDWEGVIAAAQKRLKGFITSADKLSSKSFMSGFAVRVDDLKNALIGLSTTQIDFKNADIDVVRQQVEAFLSTLRTLEDELNTVSNASVKGDVIPADVNDIKALDNAIMSFLDNNTAAGKKSKDALNAIHVELRRIINTGEELSEVDLGKFRGNVEEIEAEVRKLHQTGNSFFSSFIKQLKSANAQFFATYFSFQDMIRYLRAIVTTVTEVDSALTELRKVSDASTERLAQNFETSAETAKELGSSISHVINVTADWARLGYDVDQAEKLARVTTLFQNVGDNMSADDASSYLISTLQGFQLETEKAERIVDVYNEVANNFAIDTAGIGEALTRSAASFYAANTSLEKSVSLITATNEVVQNPEAVGTLWKTLSARIRGAKTELAELGEEEDDFTNTTSKLRDLVKSLTGFDIMEDENTFKDIYEIILGIGKEWKNLTDIEQASLGEALAGKRNANALYAVLNNIDTLEDAYAHAQESAGSAQKEQENYMKSIQYSLDRFTASLQELEADFLSSGLLKDIVDIGTSIINFLDEIVEHIGLLGGAAAVGSIVGLVTNLDKVKASFTATKAVLDTLSASGGVSQVATNVNALADATKGLTEAQAKQILTLAGVSAADKEAILTQAGFTAANGTATVSVEAFTAALWGNIKALGVWLVTNPVGWAVLAVGAIAGAVAIYDALTISVEEATEALEELDSESKKAKDELEQHSKKVSELSDSYFELAKGVDSVSGKNISLSDEDYKEFVSTNQELAELFPQLISGVDEYGNYILDLGDNADEARGKLAELLKQEQERYDFEMYSKLDEANKNAQVLISDAITKLENAQTEFDSFNASLKSIKSLTEGEQIVLTADVSDEKAMADLDRYVDDVQKVINVIRAKDTELANRLQDVMYSETNGMTRQSVINLQELSEDDREAISKYAAEFASQYDTSIKEAMAKISIGQSDLDTAWRTLSTYMAHGVNFLAEDDATKDSLHKLLNSLPAEFAKSLDGVNLETEIDKWISQYDNLDEKGKELFDKILDPELTPQQQVDLYNELRGYLPNEFTIPIKFVVDENQDLLNRVEASKWEVSKTVYGYNKVNEFFTEEQIDTAEEYNKWLEAVAQSQGSLYEAIRLYREEVNKIPEFKDDSNLVDIATTLNTKVKPAVDSLGKLYQSMFYGKDNKFDASKLAPDELADIKENFITNLTDLKVPLEDAKEKVNEFFTVLSDPNVDEKKAHAAFNKLLSEYFYAAGGLDDLNEKTADGLKKMLKALDVANADEVVDNAIKDMSKINDVLKAASQIDFDSRIKDAKANLDDEIEKISEFFEDKEPEDIERLTKEITSGAVQSKFGNVDMDKRTVIHWSNEIKKTWEDELKSWGYDPEVGGIDTVRGESSAFFLGEKEVEVAFTPIMVDKDGKNPQYLSQGTVDGYIQSILDEADKEVKKSGKQYSEEAVIEKAIELDFKGKTVDKIDSEGKKVGQQFVHGLIAGIGDEAIDIGSLLHFAGDYGAWELGQKKLEAYKSLKEKAAKGTLDLTNLTAAEIEVLKDEGYATEAVAKQMALLAMQKQLTGETKISTSQQVQALYNLGIQAGMTAAELAVLNDIMRDLDMADNVEKYDTKAAEAIRTRAQAKLDTFKERVQETLNSTLIYGPANTETAKGAGKDAGDAYVEAFEKELKELEEQRDAGVISEKQFLEKYKALIEKYFKDVDGYGEEYAKRMGDYFQRAISYYESIFSAVGTLLDKRISAAQKSKDAAVDALNAEKEAALAAYDAQLEALDELIDAKQKEIDKLREEHEERQRNIDLQKAQYELQKAQQQRTRLIYKDGQMVYENDTTAVRDAKEQVENSEYEIAIAKLEKEKELLEEQREAIEKAREAAEKYYDKLISDTEKYWDTIIDALEKQKSKWDELSSIKEIADAYALIQEAGEELGYSVEDILNDVPGAFEAFRDAYINVLKEANSENKNFLDGLANATGTAKDSVNSALGEIGGKASEVSKALEPLGDVSSKLGDTANSLSGIADNSGTAASNVGNLSSSLTEAGKSAADVSTIDSSIKSIAGASLDGTVEAFKNLASHLRGCASALGIGDGEISALESAVDKLSQINLGDDNTGAIGAFNSLASAVGNVTSAIGAVAGGGMADATQSQTGGVPVSGGTGGLIGAIEGVKDAAEKNIGTSSSAGQDVGEDAGNTTGEGGGTAIADFDALYGAVGNVVKAIGDPETEYAEEGTSLVNAIKGLPLIGETALRGEGGIIKMFEDLLEVLEQCVEKADDLLRSINAFKSSGGYSLLMEHTGNVHVGFSTGNVHGNAYASGKLGLKSSENALVGEIGQELVYNPASGTYRTVGDHGPEITRLQKGDLIFNAEQTKAIIKHGKHGGNSYANGSGLMPLSNAEVNMFKTMGNALVGIKADTSQMLEPIKSIAQNINKVTTNNISPTINISGTSFNVSGVTGEAVAAQIRDTFAGMISNAYQRAMT